MNPEGLRLSPRPKYAAIALTALQRAIAYRGTTLMNTVANLAWLAILYYLWRTVFEQASAVVGFGWAEMRTYVLVAFATNSLLGFYAAGRMMNSIRTGDVAMDLTRPIDHMRAQLAEAVGAALVEGAITTVLALAVGVILLGAQPPASVAAAALFAISVVLGFTIKFLLTYLMALCCFWTLNGIGLIWAQTAIVNVLSGALIPLALFPDWVRPVVAAMPFQGIVHSPVALYLGQLHGAESAIALAVQVAWIVALWWLARLLWIPASRALTVQGG